MERRLEQITDRRKREAGRDIPRGIDRDAMPSCITERERPSTKPCDIVLCILSKIAWKEQVLLEQLFKHDSGLLTVIHQGRIRLAVQSHVPMVRANDRQKSTLLRKRHHLRHFIAIRLTDNAGQELQMAIMLEMIKIGEDGIKLIRTTNPFICGGIQRIETDREGNLKIVELRHKRSG